MMKDIQGGISQVGSAERGDAQVMSLSSSGETLNGKIFSYLKNWKSIQGQRLQLVFYHLISELMSHWPNQLNFLINQLVDMSQT